MTSILEETTAGQTGAVRRNRLETLRPIWEPLLFLVVMSVAFLNVSLSLQFVVMTAAIYALATASISVLLGWSGVYTFGHAAFFGVGAYTAALMKERELMPLLVVGAAVLAAALIALIVGALGSRIVGVEFAIMTLILGQVAYLLTFKVDALEGDNGIYGIPAGELFGLDLLDGNNLWWYVIGTVAVVLGVMRRIHMSPYGSALNAVRDDPVKAAAVGLPVRGLRMSAFVLAGAIAGLAGALFAQVQGIVTPSTLGFVFSGQLIIMALLGGIFRFWGGPIGAVVFVILNDRIIGETSHATLILGVILLVIVLVLPTGLLGLWHWMLDRVKGAVRR